MQYNIPLKETKILIEAKDAQGCLIEISDNGPGFPLDKLNRVFEKFYRLPNTNTGGTGLGLSIVKGFVESHHGSIQLKNLPGKGAKFTIHILAKTTYVKTEDDD
jgi:two-component system, OmpR family, sensor histidine kinase KdpD